ncbi:NYN domain-containing protein [Endozoicomonas sp. ALC066]|uniref:NYN domain-containing protein n=1 Tax=Endozoicomonas sp. ALC066 TaxID=3403078 RepID=UPI003BB5ED65
MKKIGFFIDGQFYLRVNNLIKGSHDRNLDLAKIKRSVEMKVVSISGERAAITESHFFAGRSTWNKVKDEKVILSKDRFVDSFLMTSDTLPHFQPLRELTGSRPVEKGVDVDLACTVMESVFKNNLDWVALFTGDSDFTPLLTILKKHGVRTIIVGDEGTYMEGYYKDKVVNVAISKSLIQRAYYTVSVSEMKDSEGISMLSKGSNNYLLTY